MLGYVTHIHKSTHTVTSLYMHRIFLYFSVSHRARKAQDYCQGLPSRSPPSWTAWLLDSKTHCALIRIYFNYILYRIVSLITKNTIL